MRVAFAVSAAAVLFAAAPAFADAQTHVLAAKHAERRGEWHKALAEWKAAYSADVNAEYLIGIGDSYAHIGNKGEARKNYEAYLADPLALPANVERVKVKVANLDGGSSGALALPGGPGLDLPGAAAPPPLGLPDAPAPAAESSSRRGKKKRGGDAAPPPLPGLDLPGAPAQTASNNPPPLTLPGLDLPPPPPKSQPTQVASASPGLDLPLPDSPPPAATTTTTTITTTPPPARTPPAKTVASSTPTVKPASTATTTTRVPDAAISDSSIHAQPDTASHGSRVAAWVVAGIAVVGLGFGAFEYTQASSANSEVTGSVHDGATAQSLLQTQKTDKTLSFVGIAGGLVAGGVAAALFAF